jgi:uncharacterized protein YjbJ (UPF0337 family)
MTNTYSGSLSNTSRDDSENLSSNEIRADIDNTRASVGEKIDQLQARLDPSRLKAQATETVQEMLSDTANSMTEYVKTHKDEMVHSLTDAARRNPLPTALIGLGLGWLVLESMSGNRRDEDDDYYTYERRNFRPRRRARFEGSSGRSFVSQGRGQYMEGMEYSPEYFDAPDYGRSGYPTQGSMSGSQYQGSQYQGSQYQNRQEFPTDYSKEFGNGHHRNPLEKATDAVKDTMSDVTHEIKDRVEGAGQEIKDRMSDMKDSISGAVSGAVDDMRHQVSRAGDRMGNQMSNMGDRMGDRFSNMEDRMGNRMSNWSDQGQERWFDTNERMRYMQRQARWEAERRGRQVMRNLEDNPLTYGALALAAGAAIALLLPQTRAENRAFGEMRDELMDRGQEAFDSARMRAQEVVSEVRPEFEQKARQIVSEATEIGKEVVKDAANELKPVVDKAVSKGKEEARGVAKEMGVNPDKLTGSQPALNRDTMSGQWKQIRGDIKSKWGQLTDDDLTRIEGDYEKLVGSIQTRYGHTREQVEREINDFFNTHKAKA